MDLFEAQKLLMWCMEPPTVKPLDQNDLPFDEETERYVGEDENGKSRFCSHTPNPNPI